LEFFSSLLIITGWCVFIPGIEGEARPPAGLDTAIRDTEKIRRRTVMVYALTTISMNIIGAFIIVKLAEWHHYRKNKRR